MQTPISTRTPHTLMTLSAACLFSEASVRPSISTGKERDTESGNDYFGARYYASSMGRFMSPYWSAKEDSLPYAQLDDPQSLNLYSDVRNNPLAQTDPDGHCCEELIGVATDAIEDFALSHPGVVDAVAGPIVESASSGAGSSLLGSALGIGRGVVGGIVGAMIYPPTVGLSEADEIAQRDQLDREKQSAEPQTASGGAMKGNGRGGKQARLRDLANDDKASSADRGWIKSEQNQIEIGNRSKIRVPPGKHLAHREERKRERAMTTATATSKIRPSRNAASS
jgi:RHS repeat-associated protein